jgi:NAD(P)-dependent dehydrogenase (short-subunit alcohol dehydrogenase family)
VKSILITGATGGLGSEVLARLERDYRCIPLVRSESSRNELRNAIVSVDELREPVYALVLLAGAFTMGSSIADFEAMLDANLMSAVRTVEATRTKIEDGGRIVAIGSAASLTKPAGMAAYVASKAALNAYIESLANELRPRRITANALLPTALDTPAMRKSMPANRLVTLDRVTETIAFLLREDAAAVTGQLIALMP